MMLRNMTMHPFERRLSFIRQSTGQQLVEYDAEGVEIAPMIYFMVDTSGAFGRHVSESVLDDSIWRQLARRPTCGRAESD
ncbi:hypothetical protein WT13_32070 [Burkholderia anthina]|nr:hypothetical protein WT13_32070 [Burkholderia anthina]